MVFLFLSFNFYFKIKKIKFNVIVLISIRILFSVYCIAVVLKLTFTKIREFKYNVPHTACNT